MEKEPTVIIFKIGRECYFTLDKYLHPMNFKSLKKAKQYFQKISTLKIEIKK